MKKVLIIIGAMGCIVFGLMIYGIFFSNWGENGWSNVANITIREQGLKQIGKIENVDVFTYNLADIRYIHISAKEMILDDFIQQDWVKLKHLLYGEKSIKDIEGSYVEVYKTENYMVMYVNETLIYAPLGEDVEQILIEANGL